MAKELAMPRQTKRQQSSASLGKAGESMATPVKDEGYIKVLFEVVAKPGKTEGCRHLGYRVVCSFCWKAPGKPICWLQQG